MVKRWAGALILFSAFLFVTNWGFDYLRSIDEPGIITIIPDALDVNEGDRVDLAIDSNLSPDRLNIISANFNVIRLENGRLVAQGPGSTYVTVESQDGTVQDHVLITVLSPNLEAPVDQSFTVILDGTALDYDGPVPVHALHTPAQEDFTFLGVSLKEDGAVLEPSTLLNKDTTLFSVFAAVEARAPVKSLIDPVSEDPLVEDPIDETPEDEVDDTVTGSSPSSITVTLESDQGITMSVLTVSPGSIIGVEDFDADVSDVGYFIQGETCENPFDFDTPLVTDTSIVFGEMNYTSPCIELDVMATLGKLQVGESIQAFVSPSAATITYEWFISANDRDYSLIRNITGSTLELAPEHFRQYIAVKLTGTGDYTGSLSLPLGRVGLSSQTVGSGDSGDSGGASCTLTPINTTSTFLNMTSDGCYELTTDIDLSGLGTLNQSALDFVFTGTLDGKGFSILYLDINSSQNYIGLFKMVSGASITQLTLENFEIEGSNYVGTLAGSAVHSTLSSIQLISNQVKGTRYLGGMVGQGVALTISNSALSSTTILGLQTRLGGLIGLGEQLTLSHNTLTQTSISGDWLMGGLVGYITNGPTLISNTVMTHTTVTGSRDNVGGLVGILGASATIIHSTLSNVNLTGRANVGGLVGFTNGTVITDAVVDGSLTGNGTGYIVGNSDTTSTITNASFTGTINGSEDNSIE